MTTSTASPTRIHAELAYQAASDCSFLFAVVAARTDHQAAVSESLVIEPDGDVETLPYGDGGHQLVRVTVPPGPLRLIYDAAVRIEPQREHVATLDEVPFRALPSAVLHFVNPSRYCESDKLLAFALREFGDLAPGHARVRAISDWVGRNLTYVAGVTDASSSTADVLLQRAGVCRDYAHVAISLCRALGIPARYVSGYGVGVDPPDFHGFFEAYLAGDWYLFDPTGMAPADGLVRIAYGRDAADTPFATFVGSATLTRKVVTISRDPGTAAPPPTQAVSTA
ncbi:MAG: transglutaminase family protein [Lautropia sp.]